MNEQSLSSLRKIGPKFLTPLFLKSHAWSLQVLPFYVACLFKKHMYTSSTACAAWHRKGVLLALPLHSFWPLHFWNSIFFATLYSAKNLPIRFCFSNLRPQFWLFHHLIYIFGKFSLYIVCGTVFILYIQPKIIGPLWVLPDFKLMSKLFWIFKYYAKNYHTPCKMAKQNNLLALPS